MALYYYDTPPTFVNSALQQLGKKMWLSSSLYVASFLTFYVHSFCTFSSRLNSLIFVLIFLACTAPSPLILYLFSMSCSVYFLSLPFISCHLQTAIELLNETIPLYCMSSVEGDIFRGTHLPLSQ